MPNRPFLKHAVITVLTTLTLAMSVSRASDEAPAKSVAGAEEELRGDADRGSVDYATYCGPCHGPQGNALGPMSALLDPKPTRHSDTAYMTTLSDEYMYRLIRDGGPAYGKSPMMAPWGGTLSDQQIWDLVAYIRSLAE